MGRIRLGVWGVALCALVAGCTAEPSGDDLLESGPRESNDDRGGHDPFNEAVPSSTRPPLDLGKELPQNCGCEADPL